MAEMKILIFSQKTKKFHIYLTAAIKKGRHEMLGNKISDAIRNVEGLIVTDEEMLGKILQSFYIVSTIVLFFCVLFFGVHNLYTFHSGNSMQYQHYPSGCTLEILNIAWGDISLIVYEVILFMNYFLHVSRYEFCSIFTVSVRYFCYTLVKEIILKLFLK